MGKSPSRLAWMTYRLEFHPNALKEWSKLDATIKAQFKKKLNERLKQPLVLSAAVSGGADLYKIKLATVGYRLVYKVVDDTVTIVVI